MNIKHLKHTEIDFERWDHNVENAVNSFVYAYSWYLDIVSPGWEALVSDHYEFIMPLPLKKKYGISYLVQPFLTQQLGVFSKSKIDGNITRAFIKKIPYLSYQLSFHHDIDDFETSEFPNYIIHLSKDYESIQACYSKNTLRNIGKAEKYKLSIDDQISTDEFTSFYVSVHRNFRQPIPTEMLLRLLKKGMAFSLISLSGVRNESGELIAAVALLVNQKRIIYLLPASNEEGKKKSAMFLQIDRLLKSNAKTGKIIDFEGSKIEGVARFYKGFGAKKETYFVVKKMRPSFLVGKI